MKMSITTTEVLQFLIGDLTPLGHEFLANIRAKSLWNKVKSKATDASLSILMELAKRAATDYFLG